MHSISDELLYFQMRLQFREQLTETFEYPSEVSLLEGTDSHQNELRMAEDEQTIMQFSDNKIKNSIEMTASGMYNFLKVQKKSYNSLTLSQPVIQ